jgi:hypothetical protein
VYRSVLVTSLLTTAVLLAGCSAEAAGTASPGTGSPSSTSAVPSAPTPSEPADATGDGTGGDGTGDEGPSDQSPSDQSPSDQGPSDQDLGGQGSNDDGSGSESSDGGTEGLPGWPIESTPVHGARLWAAYLAVGAPGDPALHRVLADVQQLWPGAGLGELGCDQGAAAALGRSSEEHAVAVYFPTEQHVTEFRRRWDAPYVGAVQVTTLCAD